VDARIIGATRALLADVGYSRLSFEMIAQSCGVTRPTIYRRWTSKAHLVFEATLPEALDDIAHTDDLAADIRGFVARIAAMFSEPIYRAALPGLLTDFAGNPEYEGVVIDDLWTGVRTQFVDRISMAHSKGEAGGDIDPLDILDVIVGTLYQRIIVLQQPLPDQVDRLTNIAMRLLSSRRTPSMPDRALRRSD
jgi:AcrR family transcriptional regulator